MSSTAAIGSLALTAFYCCALRAADAERPVPVCGDTFAARFIDPETLDRLRPALKFRGPAASNVARHRIVDDIVRAALEKNPGMRIVLLGAGDAMLVWVATLESGVHATIAGVALAFMTPSGDIRGRPVLEELENRIHPWTSFLILPIFALANAGVVIGGDALDAGDGMRTALAVAIGLMVGKLVGISAATLLAVRFRLGLLPRGVDRRSVIGIAALAGIGFTVSLFIAALAFDDPLLVDSAKLGILGGSIVSAAIGVAILAPGGRHPSRRRDPDPDPSRLGA